MRQIYSGFLSAAFAILAFVPAHAETVYTVQLGSFKNEAEAQAHWDKLLKTFPDIFDPLSYTPAEIQLPPDKNIYHRTQAGPIASREEADRICERLTVKEFECYVAETAMFKGTGEPDTVVAMEEDVTQAAPAAGAAPTPPVPAKQEQAKPEPKEDKAPVATAANIEPDSEEEDIKAIFKSSEPKPAAPAAVPQAPAEPVTTPAPAAASTPQQKSTPLPSPKLVSSDKTPEKTTAPAPQVTAQEAIDQVREKKAAAPAPAKPAPVAVQKPAPVAPATMPWQAAPAAGKTPAPAPVKQAEMTPPPAPAPVPVKQAVTPPPPLALQPPTPTMEAPPLTPSTSDKAQVKVAEAIPVPLSTVPSQSAASPAYDVAFHGLPSQIFYRASLWAEIGNFTNQDAALGYWRLLLSRDPGIPTDLRLRVITPLGVTQGHAVSLRVGPFTNGGAVQRLCALTHPEGLYCRTVKDLGTSVAVSDSRQRMRPGDRYAMARYRQPAANASLGTSDVMSYWIQFGAYPTPEAAMVQWNVIRAAHGKLLGKMREDIVMPRYSSAAHPVFRLRTGPFPGSVEPVGVCNQMRQQGTTCIVVPGY